MTESTLDRVDQLEQKFEQLMNREADQGADLKGRVHMNGEHAAFSFFESDQPGTAMAKSMKGRPFYRGRSISMPKSYEAGNFENFGSFLRMGMKSPGQFKTAHAKSVKSLAKALNVNVSEFEDGGSLVLPEFAPEIMRMLYTSESLWGRTRQYTVAGNSMSFPRLRDQNRANGQRHGGVLGYWTGEGEEVTESQIKFDSTDIKLDKLSIAVFVTEEMLSDSGYAIEQFASEVAQAEIDYQLDKSLLRGDNVGKPLGILNSDSRVVQAKESGQAANTIVSDNLLNMWSRRLSAGAGDDLVWLINQDIEPQLAKQFISTGSNSGELVYMPPTGLSDSPYATLNGRPVIPSEHCSTLGTEGDIILSNFKYFLSINKGQVNQLASPHVKFLQDLLCIKFTFRVSGRPAYDKPVTVEQSNKTRSAFITLADRA